MRLHETNGGRVHFLPTGPHFVPCLAEFWDFLIHNKKWWLAPIIVALLLMGLLVMLSGTPDVPFIYTLW